MEFSYTQPISYAWDIFKAKWKFLVPLIIVYVLLSWIPSFFIGYFEEREPLVSSIFSLVSTVLSIFLSIGFIRIGLAIIDNKETEYKDLFSGGDLFLKYLLGSLLYGVIVIGGLLLFIIPGIIWSLKYQFYGELIVDRGYSGWDAFKKSAEITNGYKVKLAMFGFVLGLLSMLGLLAFGVGVLVSSVVGFIAYLKVYRDLFAASEKGSQSDGQPGPKPLYQADVKPEAVSLS